MKKRGRPPITCPAEKERARQQHNATRAVGNQLKLIALDAFSTTLNMPVADWNAAKNSVYGWAPRHLDIDGIQAAILLMRQNFPHPTAGTVAAVSRDDASWAAGFVDGDGYVGAIKWAIPGRSVDGIRVKFSISQNKRRPLARLHTILGTHTPLRDVNTENHSLNAEPSALTLDGIHAIHALTILYPYLVRKKVETEVLIGRLWFEGRLWEQPGVRGVDPVVQGLRDKWFIKLQRLH